MENNRNFSLLERKILQLVQTTLPDSATPFADIAEQLGIDEQFILQFLTELKQKGYIRRFGATLRHQEAGYDCNVMVAWQVKDSESIEQISKIMIERPEITHCYQRKNSPKWPYNLYTMIHGKNQKECLKVVGELQKVTGIENYELLFSEGELKKTSMQYF